MLLPKGICKRGSPLYNLMMHADLPIHPLFILFTPLFLSCTTWIHIHIGADKFLVSDGSTFSCIPGLSLRVAI